MRLTAEQTEIVECQGHCRVNACAGSGKTSTLVAYAAKRPKANILYIAYNKSVKDEAIIKFKAYGVNNITVETAHSLAYKQIVSAAGYETSLRGLKVLDVMDFCKIKSNNIDGVILAQQTLNYLSAFCNSSALKLNEIDYKVQDPVAQQYIKRNATKIRTQAKQLFNAMIDGDLPITHDAYLKYYQLQEPKLPFTHILFDEGQDANPCMLAIFQKQSGIKVIVGDTYQSIYSFNGAVNSLEMVDYPIHRLTKSFRFNQKIANLALSSLSLKKYLGLSISSDFSISGMGEEPLHNNTTGIITRSNATLLQKAIEYACDNKLQIGFEGGLKGYPCMSGGSGLFDLLNLYLGKNERIYDDFYKSFKSYELLLEYQEATLDRELGMMKGVIEKYNSALFPLLKEIKNMEVNRNKAHIILSSVHKSKGQEYDKVILGNDFISGDKLITALSGGGKLCKNGTTPEIKELNEEINILYVALTRTKGEIEVPFGIMPSEPSA